MQRSFFYKERKRMQRSFRSFIKNGKERTECSILLKRTDAQPWTQKQQQLITKKEYNRYEYIDYIDHITLKWSL